MSDFLAEMKWYVCPDGYHVAPAPSESLDTEWLVANSTSIRTYKPFQKYEMLYSAFAKLKTRDDVLGFMNQFGPITVDDALDVEANLRDAKAFRELLFAKQKSAKNICLAFERHMALVEAARFKRISDRFRARLRKHGYDDEDPIVSDRPEPNEFFVGDVVLEPDPHEGLRLRIKPYSLMYGLWVQLGRKLSSKTIIRTCRYCGSTFEAGAGSKKTGRCNVLLQ